MARTRSGARGGALRREIPYFAALHPVLSRHVRCMCKYDMRTLSVSLLLALAAMLPVGSARAFQQPTSIASNGSHSCVILTDSSVRCWGTNNFGQIGDGTIESRPTPVIVQDVNQVTTVTVGATHTCALLSTGRIKCWGNNGNGQLGDGTTDDSLSAVDVDGITNAIDVAAGDSHTCAVIAGGGVRCWGMNDDGQLGDGTNSERHSPTPVSGISNATQIAVGQAHSCAILSSGLVNCWGANDSGQLGDSTTNPRNVPAGVSSLSGVGAVTSGRNHVCAVLNGSNLVRCWGYNVLGAVGDNSQINRLVPTAPSGLSQVQSIVAGGDHTCAIANDGTGRCWGSNQFGELGNGTIGGKSLVPVTVSLLSGAPQLAVGFTHSCALFSDYSAKCWGNNNEGALGTGGTASSTVPVSVFGMPPKPVPATNFAWTILGLISVFVLGSRKTARRFRASV